MTLRPYAWVMLAAVTAAGCCTPPTSRVVLLPGSAGRPTGAVLVTPKPVGSAASGVASGGANAVAQSASAPASAPPTVRLDTPYALTEANVGGTLRIDQTTEAAVQRRYGRLLALKPAEAQRWILNFEPGTDKPTEQSQAELPQIIEAVRGYPPGELIIEGHTDRVGALEANDRLSLVRAEAVRRLLIEAGLAAQRIQAVGRGERAPLVPTEDEVAEARNRRVEIRLR